MLGSRARFLISKHGLTWASRPTASRVASKIHPTQLEPLSSSHRFSSTLSPPTPITNGVVEHLCLPIPSNASTVATTIGDVLPALPYALQYGDFKAMGLCNNTPVGAIEWALEAFRVSSGLPWWAIIVSSVIVTRAALMPLVMSSQRNNALLHNIRPEMDAINTRIAVLTEAGDKHKVSEERYRMAQIYRKHGVNPLKSLVLPLVQAPVMISFFIALRAIASLDSPVFHQEGLLWFHNLALPDPTYALPVLTGITFFSVLQGGMDTGGSQGKKSASFFKVLSIAMIPLTASLPTAVHLYWLVSNVISIGQAYVFKKPAIRSRFNIATLKKIPDPITLQTGIKPKLTLAEAFQLAKAESAK